VHQLNYFKFQLSKVRPCRNPKAESPKPERSPKSEGGKTNRLASMRISDFGLRFSALPDLP